MLKRGDYKSPFPAGTVASPQQVMSWDKSQGRCCTADSFSLDLRSTARSPWNSSATKVFVDEFKSIEEYECKDDKLIAAAFSTHFRTLKRHWKRQQQEEAAAQRSAADVAALKAQMALAAKQHSRDQRKYNVRDCRVL